MGDPFLYRKNAVSIFYKLTVSCDSGKNIFRSKGRFSSAIMTIIIKSYTGDYCLHPVDIFKEALPLKAFS